ncbi:DUF2971 domain-containing protein, partial [Elstera litoralis]|uniref:DUF2971 domain-containing protein n=1 Tax=Elstera litoralis TaxID=552518 RepID=UPI0018DEAADA
MLEPEYKNLSTFESYFKKPYFPGEKEIPTLVHYTTLDSLLGIVGKQKFWATHISYMNDPHDGYELYSFVMLIIREHLLSANYGEKISTLDNLYGQGVYIDPNFFSDYEKLSIDIDENEFLFDIYVTMISIRQARDCFGDKKLNKFLISFSKYHEDNHIDRWRTYANDATGFRLEFDFSAFKKSVLKCFNAP